MSQQQQSHQQPFFCPHIKLRTTVELLFPKKVYASPTSPSSSSSSSEISSTSVIQGALANEIENDGGFTNFSQNNNCSSASVDEIRNGCGDVEPNIHPASEDVRLSDCEEMRSNTSASSDNMSDITLTPLTPKSENKELQQQTTASCKNKKKKKSNVVSVLSCSQCGPCDSSTTAGSGDNRRKVNYWKCLDPNCQLILCGAAGENHAQLHYQEYQHHMLQQNITSNRIWCNECNHEVYNDFRSRRIVPAIWTTEQENEEEPPKGLYNIGNTCFMNAALQNIAAVSPLTSYLLGDCSDLTGKYVASNYRWLLSEFYVESPGTKYNKGIMPSRLLHSVRTAHPIFRGFQQHDAQEFLRLFMDTLAEQTFIPHFVLDDPEKIKDSSDNESETESFETCDSGNGSEETDVNSKPEEPADSECSEEELTDQPTKIIMKSIISDVFDGQIESSVQCLSCHQTSRRTEVFQDLSLPIPTKDELATLRDVSNYDRSENDEGSNTGWLGWIWGWMKSFFWGPAPTLEDCFAAFFSSDELKGKNMYSCEKCGKLRNGVKRCSLLKLPEILCVHLKRFRMYEFNGGMGYSGKISQYVQFPTDGLDVRPFMHKDCVDEVSNYRLMGVICHIGSVMGGHYTAYIRKNDQYFLADDSHVGTVAQETVMDCEAYVLFYQKWNWEDDFNKHDLLKLWTNVDRLLMAEDRFHLVSRKWLTKFFWGEEGIPLDNSDVVCPHGYIAPYESIDYGATWVPHCVWDLIMKRYGGGPDLKYSGECSVCSQIWKKYQKSLQKNGTTSRTQSFSESVSGSPKFNFMGRNILGNHTSSISGSSNSCLLNNTSSNESSSRVSNESPSSSDAARRRRRLDSYNKCSDLSPHTLDPY